MGNLSISLEWKNNMVRRVFQEGPPMTAKKHVAKRLAPGNAVDIIQTNRVLNWQ